MQNIFILINILSADGLASIRLVIPIINIKDRHLTHWGRDKMAAISQTAFSSASLWMKTFEFWIELYWNMFFRVSMTIWQHWFRYDLALATSHYLNQWWQNLLTHICVTWRQWLNCRIYWIWSERRYHKYYVASMTKYNTCQSTDHG